MAGAVLQRTKEKEAAQSKRFPCPWPEEAEMRENELVAEEARCTVMQAKELGESDLAEFNRCLFRALAKAEARPIAQAVADEKAQREEAHKKAARGKMN